MLSFIIPLRAPESTDKWSLVSAVALRTVRSCLRQTDNANSRVILVCHHLPENFAQAEYLASQQQSGRLVVICEKFSKNPITEPLDSKYEKIKRGLMQARTLGTDYIMNVDADDLVHQNLTQFIHNQADKTASWLISQGFVIEPGRQIIIRRNDFNILCGSSAIIKVEPADLPASMDAPREDFFILTHGHNIIHEWFAGKNLPLNKIPFAAGMYVTNYGASYTGTSLWRVRSKKYQLGNFLNARFFSAKIKAAFGYYEI